MALPMFGVGATARARRSSIHYDGEPTVSRFAWSVTPDPERCMAYEEATSFLEDEPAHLRVWGTDTVYRLPAAPVDTAVIWAADLSDLAMVGPDAAPVPVTVTRAWDRWIMRANDGPIVVDGSRQPAAMLAPGMEVQVSGVTLVVEGCRWASLRAFVARLVGWNSAPTIDRAMRALRLAAERRAPLALCGPGDMIAIAQALHRRAFGGAPFVSCDKRRLDAPGNARSARSVYTAAAAIRVATGGTICVWCRRLPDDIDRVVADVHGAAPPARMILCSEALVRRAYHVDQIEIPPLYERAHDVKRIVDEYAEDEAEDQAAVHGLGAGDRWWIVEHASRTIPEIHKAARRLVAIRNSASAAAAARSIGMKPISLLRWFERGRARPAGVGVRQMESVAAFRAAHFRSRRSNGSARTA